MNFPRSEMEISQNLTKSQDFGVNKYGGQGGTQARRLKGVSLPVTWFSKLLHLTFNVCTISAHPNMLITHGLWSERSRHPSEQTRALSIHSRNFWDYLFSHHDDRIALRFVGKVESHQKLAQKKSGCVNQAWGGCCVSKWRLEGFFFPSRRSSFLLLWLHPYPPCAHSFSFELFRILFNFLHWHQLFWAPETEKL